MIDPAKTFSLLGMDFPGNELWVHKILLTLRDPPLSPEELSIAQLMSDIGLSAPSEWEYDPEYIKEQVLMNEPTIRQVLFDELSPAWRIRRDLEDRPYQVGSILLYTFGGSIVVQDGIMFYFFLFSVFYLFADRYVGKNKDRM